jgi:hypothetical protein
MFQEKQKSTLSIPMEQSKHSESIIALGKRLVKELGMEPGVDTLGRWMAHYIAELIKMSEETEDLDERSKAQEKCCDTIIKLWEHRSSLIHCARPLANLEGVLKAINNLREEKTPWSQFSAEEGGKLGGPWMTFANTLEEVGLRMCKIAVLTAIGESSFGTEKRWMQEHGDMLSKEEAEIIQGLDIWLLEEIPWEDDRDRLSVGAMESDERTKRAVEEFNALFKKLMSAFEKLQTKVLS